MDPLQELKGFDPNRTLALIKKLGGRGIAEAILRGEKKVTVEDAICLLFDKHGRRIPEGLKANVCDANRDFRLEQPKLDEEIDFANRILRLHGCLSIDTGVTAEQFKTETERLLTVIRGNSRISNMSNGIYLPVILPKLVTDDLGAELELYLAAVGNSYAKTFSERTFNNYRKGSLVSNVIITEGSRHNQLIEKMKQEVVMGIHFPNPLQGFSVNADIEQMSTLPEGFILSGMDTPIAMVMYPDILARDWKTPGLDLAAFSLGQSAVQSLDFRADDDELDFGDHGGLGHAYAHYSGGLLFLG